MITALTIFLGLLAISLHELGHYEAMRRSNVWVKEVSLLGFPIKFLPSFRYTHRGTTWSIHLFVLGAYVTPRTSNYLEQLPLWDRLYIFGNGITANIVYAVLLIVGADAVTHFEHGSVSTGFMFLVAACGVSALLWYARRFVCIATMVLSFPLLTLIGYVLINTTFGESVQIGDGGPVAMVKLLNDAEYVAHGMRLAGFLSLNLAAINLLPLPGLDGGHMYGAVVHRYLGKHAYAVMMIVGLPLILYLIGRSFALDAVHIWNGLRSLIT